MSARKPAQRPVVQQQQQKRQGDRHRLGRQRGDEARQHGQIPDKRKRPPRIAQVGGQRQHEEQPAEHVLALGHPGHRFPTQRMKGEDGGGQRARPETARHPPKNHEQQDRRGGVQRDVRQVMDCGAVAQKVPHQDVRDARQRGPAFQMALGEYGGESPRGQLAGHQPVFRHAFGIVVVDEIEARRLSEHQSDRQQQQAANGQSAGAVRTSTSGRPSGNPGRRCDARHRPDHSAPAGGWNVCCPCFVCRPFALTLLRVPFTASSIIPCRRESSNFLQSRPCSQLLYQGRVLLLTGKGPGHPRDRSRSAPAPPCLSRW